MDAFLSEVRAAITQARCIFHGNKVKNRNTLTKLGFTLDDMYDEIYTLTYKDYLYGPEQDRRPDHGTKNIWVFKKFVKGMLVYIKLEIIIIAKETLVVLSFHEDNVA